ncbi:MAG: AMP-binding protein [Deltaproteobacteria bacterium]|nr:AMP-binding protein [Deltaproteobacteria bacterium]
MPRPARASTGTTLRISRRAPRRTGGGDGTPPAMLLPTTPAFLRLQAQRRGARGGIVFRDRHITYGELAAAVDELATWLAARGVGAGQRVGLMAGNEPALVAANYALWGLGATVVPIAVRATAGETALLLAHARASALLCDAARAEVARGAAIDAGLPLFAVEPELPLRPRIARRTLARVVPPRAPRPTDLAVLAYTSGTTGAPKGVMLPHGNLLWAAAACAAARGDSAASVGASISPLSHTPVLVSHLLCRVLSGATTVLLERFDLPALFEAVERFGVTDLPLIGGMVFDVIAGGAVPAGVRRTVAKVSVGGAPTPMSAKRELAACFAGAEIIEAYGQTESTDGVTMARGTSVFDRPGTVGAPNPYLVVAIQHADGRRAAVDEEGEIVVGGPTVMSGYYRDRAASAAAVRDGWLHTGDRGRQDADGYVYITGRMKDLIITGGENVSPVEVEDALRAHPDIDDVAVIGTPHPKWGEQVTAIVVRRPGTRLDADAVAAFAAARLAGFKKPRRVEFVEQLPRNAANKVMTGVLKERFGSDAS